MGHFSPEKNGTFLTFKKPEVEGVHVPPLPLPPSGSAVPVYRSRLFESSSGEMFRCCLHLLIEIKMKVSFVLIIL